MANIDDKVVAMSFEGGKFEAGVRTTLSALEKLKQALNFTGSSKGLNDISRESNKVNFSRMASGIEDVKNRLGALRLAAIAVFSQMASRAIAAGLQFAKSFTIQPIMQGLNIYETKLQAIQTVMANTSAQGTKMSDVTKALSELNKYSNQTIYNFGQMAKNIGTFTAAGVDLRTATASIKGIANLAALSGSSADQASTAMYQLSQAIAAGRVSLQDWNSVVNAGMGGAVFQKALANTAEAMGQLKDGSVQLVGPMKQLKINGESFRESVGGPGPKWLTSDVLTKTLEQFTGDLSAAQLKAEGFNASQIKAIQTQAKLALHAATQVKTLGQVFDIAKETAATGWATTFETIFGGLDEAKALFTGLSNAINGFIQTSADARNKVLGDWKALGGRTVLIQGLKTAFQALGEILKPIKDAFRDIFPAQTGKSLYDLTVRFKDFTEALKPSPETVANLHKTFRGLFAVLDIGKQIVSGIFTVFKTLFNAIGGGNGSFLAFTGSIGDFLVKIDMALKKGDAFHNFFVAIGTVLSIPIKLLQHLGQAIATLFSGFSPGGFSGQMASLAGSTKPFQTAINNIVSAMQSLGPAISSAISNINWNAILTVVQTGLFAALVLMIKNFIGGTNLAQLFGIMGKNVGRSFGAGVLGNISKAFGGLSGTLSAMQNELKARTLQEIAVAIALLAASVLALSLVNPERLNASLSAMTIMFGELLGAMAIMDKITTGASFVKLPVIASSLILLAGAIDLLTLSVIAMSKLSWNDLSKGLVGVGALLGGLSAASTILGKNAAGMIRSSIGIMGIAIAMKILASAMQDFGAMNWTQLAKGLVGVAGGLTAVALSMQIMPKNMVLRSAAIIAIAAALNIIADAMGKFGAMNWSQIGRGMAGVAGSLVIIAAAIRLMPMSMVITASGLLLVASSLGKIESAVAKMGGMSIQQIGKGLIGLAGSLIILAAALQVMGGTFAGAAALGLAAAGLSLLVPALVLMGRQSWGTLLKGMIGLAASIGIIAGAALLLSPSIPVLLGFGAALVVIGAGLALAGAGIALIGVGLSAIAVSGSTAVGILITAIEQFVASLIGMSKNIVLGLLEIVKQFAIVAPQFSAALITIIGQLLDVIIQSAPKIGQAFQALLLEAIKVLNANEDKVVQAGMNLLLALLIGIKNNIGQLVTTVTDIIVNFLGAITRNLGRIVTAGAQVLISLLRGIANNMATVVTSALGIVTKFLESIATGYAKIIAAGMNIVIKLLAGIAGKIGEVIKAGTDLIVNLVTGIGNAGARIVAAGTNAMIKFVNALVAASLRLVDAGAQAVIRFLNGVASAIEKYEPQMLAAGARIGVAIVKGMLNGLVSWAPQVYNKASEIAGKVLGMLGKALHLGSPSKATEEMGGFLVQGLTKGLTANAPQSYAAAYALGNNLIGAFNNVFQTASPSKVMFEIGKYVGQGFAQGLRGSRDDINSAFSELNDKLTEAMRTARETIVSEQAKLDDLRKASKPDADAIKEAQKTIAENQAILARSTAAHSLLVGALKKNHTELNALATDYDVVSVKLQKAQDVLANAVKTRDDAIKQYKDQYSTLPDVVKTDPEGAAVDQLAAYQDALTNQISAVGAYKSTLDQLRKLGLDDATYQKLLSEGTADQEFATQLLAGGRTAVTGLNKLDQQLTSVSKGLATNAANNLYQAGVDAAEGLVRGLQAKRAKIRQTMEDIAREMIAALRKELRSKSPSQAFAEIGGDAMEGLALGFSNSLGSMKSAVENAADTAMEAMKRSMRNLAGMVEGKLDASPVITPVLDLSLVKSASGELAKLTDIHSYAQASAISVQRTATEEDAASAGTSIKFEQNNYSPEALSEVEIYRQTKNQLSQLRTAFAL